MRLGSKNLVLACLAAVVFFFFSMLLVVPYTGGDQEWYRLFYASVEGATLAEVPLIQAATTGSAEPIYGYLMWLGANIGFNKDAYISGFNAILMLVLALFLIRNNAHWIFLLLSLSNFYVIVLLTSAERLKFAYILLLFATVARQRMVRLGLFASAPLAHFQTLIFYALIAAGTTARLEIKSTVRRRAAIFALAVAPMIVFSAAIVYLKYGRTIASKAGYYIAAVDVLNLANVLVLLIVSLAVLRNKYEATIVFMIAGVAALLLTGSRVNMIAVAMFCYFCVVQRRTGHPLVLALMVYLSIKSVGFVINIYQAGTGFL